MPSQQNLKEKLLEIFKKNYVMQMKISQKKCKNLPHHQKQKNHMNYQMDKSIKLEMKNLDAQKLYSNHRSQIWNVMVFKETTYNSIMKCDVDMGKDLDRNIVLS